MSRRRWLNPMMPRWRLQPKKRLLYRLSSPIQRHLAKSHPTERQLLFQNLLKTSKVLPLRSQPSLRLLSRHLPHRPSTRWK